MNVFGDEPPPRADPPKSSKKSKMAPQEALADFWDKFHTKRPGKVTSIFPRSLYRTVLPPMQPAGARSSANAAESYEAAARECRDKVRRIVRECHRTNEKFTDPDFDIENDERDNCLNGLVRGGGGAGSGDAGAAGDDPGVSPDEVQSSLRTLAQSRVLGETGRVPVDAGMLSRIMAGDVGRGVYGDDDDDERGEYYSPGSVHRVDWIFDSPRFTVSGYSASDIKQGSNGDCWWLAAVATIANRRDLMERVCVARDETCGVYGFVFQRDGEWVSTVVDDNLYLRARDWGHYGDEYDATGRKARRYRRERQTGSEALYFACCEDADETWLPLLEKAYAKVHGDYEAISGGWPGEAVEDMTGGVTTTIASNRVLDKDKLWKELVNADGDFVFALAAMGSGWDWQKSGIPTGHAYSILGAREELDENDNKVRLVQIRNPWGERAWNGVGEWNGPWSDGSKEWTPYWLKKIGHTFGDDGVFWMSYKDMLDNFSFIHRTRIFDEKWTIVQQWTSTCISWVTGYLQNKFELEVKKGGTVLIVLTQLDSRFWKGFEGEYYFELHFLLQAAGGASSEHICRVRPVHKWENRSVSCEVELEPGKYEVLPKITATRDTGANPIQDVVKEYAERNPQKLRQVGLQFDIAHAKGGILDEDSALEKKKAEEKKKKAEKKTKAKERQKRQRAMEKAAQAMEKAADAMKEVADAEKASTTKSEETKTAVPAKPEQKEKAAEEPKALAAEKEKKDDEKKEEVKEEKKEETKEEEKKEEKEEEKKEKKEEGAGEKKQEGDAKVVDEDEDEDDDSEPESESEESDSDESKPTPWNAVAVFGLRVYARDPDVSIKLVEMANAEEAAALVVDGKPTGATL